MNNILIGLVFGAIAGAIDVLTMVIKKLPWDADLSAFSMWVVVGLMVATSGLQMNMALKGALIAFLILIPTAVIIGKQEPKSLIPISIMTLILGSLLGCCIGLLVK